jgi:TolB protein
MSATRRALFLFTASASLFTAACTTGTPGPVPSGSGSGFPDTSTFPSTGPSDRPSSLPTGSTSSVPAGGTDAIEGLTLYYDGNDSLLRLDKSGPKKIAGVSAYSANVSPDGSKIAFIENGAVVVTDQDGRQPQTVLTGAVGAGYEPSWSPDSKRVLTGKVAGEQQTALGVITVATKTFTPLPHQPAELIHPLWTGDGKHIAYATGTCQLATADIDGSNTKLVPNYANTPGGRRSCDPYSVNHDGTLISVNQRTGDEPDGDIGRDSTANAIVDTRTGTNITLPVTGTITAITFLPTGDILVRTTGKLTLLGADRTVRTQITEPAGVKTYQLISYVED